MLDSWTVVSDTCELREARPQTERAQEKPFLKRMWSLASVGAYSQRLVAGQLGNVELGLRRCQWAGRVIIDWMA